MFRKCNADKKRVWIFVCNWVWCTKSRGKEPLQRITTKMQLSALPLRPVSWSKLNVNGICVNSAPLQAIVRDHYSKKTSFLKDFGELLKKPWISRAFFLYFVDFTAFHWQLPISIHCDCLIILSSIPIIALGSKWLACISISGHCSGFASRSTRSLGRGSTSGHVSDTCKSLLNTLAPIIVSPDNYAQISSTRMPLKLFCVVTIIFFVVKFNFLILTRQLDCFC